MFTGLIESVGSVADVTRTPEGIRMRLRTAIAPGLAPGDSLAVNGVCLTVVAVDADSAAADVSPETARVTTLGQLAAGTLVNLERPLRADARVGGHFVQGHVDATGTIEALRPDGDSYRLTVRVPAALEPLIVHKGSIAVDGISLTVASVGTQQFDVQIVPFTWEHTNLHSARVEDAVNVECDILGKYVLRALELDGFRVSGRHRGRGPHGT
jgi:riboflavin synthase